MNLRDIGKDLGLSYGTVSICLSGNPEKIKLSRATVERVRTYAKEVGYVPSVLARRLFNTSETDAPLGIIYKLDTASDKTLTHLRDAMKYLTDSRREYIIQSCDEGGILNTCKVFLGMKIKRVLLLGYIFDHMLKGIESLNNLELFIPHYASKEVPKIPQIKCCYANTQDAFVCQLAKHVIKIGQGPIAADLNTQYVLDKRTASKIELLDVDFHLGLFESGAAVEKQVMELIGKKRCRTIMLHNDKIAIGLIERLIPNGIRIPEDVSIIGFNNSEISEHSVIPLSTIELSIWNNVKNILFHILNGIELPKVCKCIPTFIPRASTMPQIYFNLSTK